MINKTFNNLMDSIKELHAKKNHDYASDDNPYSNFEFAAHLVSEFNNPVDQVFAGIIGIKLARLGQLLSGKKPNNESAEDTMRDLTTYCGIWTARRINKEIESMTIRPDHVAAMKKVAEKKWATHTPEELKDVKRRFTD